MDRLQSCLDVLSEQQLRSMVLRLAAQDPYIHDIFVMELEETLNTSTDENIIPLSQRPEPSCYHRMTLSNPPVHVHFSSPHTSNLVSDKEESTYHPGELETEKYEFLTITLEGHIYREIRAVSRYERFLCGVAVTGMM
ncbi:hypothetical protein Ac2012v2_002766 [Leucoagaricus gongylophorus]